MNPKEDEVDTSADITNPRDIQGILALLFGGGFLILAIAGVWKSTSLQDVLSVLKEVGTLVAVIVAFYFGSKKAAEAS